MAKLQIFSSLAAPIEVESDQEMEKVSSPTKTPEPKHTQDLDQCKSTTKRRLSFRRIAAKVRQFPLEDDVDLFHKQWPVAKQVGGRYLSRAIMLESHSESEDQDPALPESERPEISFPFEEEEGALSETECPEISELAEEEPGARSEAERPEISEPAEEEAGELSETEYPEISELAEEEAGELSETERPGISELVLKFFPPRAQCPEISRAAEDEAGQLSEAECPEIPELANGWKPECSEVSPPEHPEIPEPAEPKHPEVPGLEEPPLLVFAKIFLGWCYCGHLRGHVCCIFVNF